jgi:hypothetical protein
MSRTRANEVRYWRLAAESGFAGIFPVGPSFHPRAFYDEGFYKNRSSPPIHPSEMKFDWYEEESERRPDFPFSASAMNLTCKPETALLFKNIFRKDCNTFNIRIRDEIFNYNVPIYEIDAIDRKRSMCVYDEERGDNKIKMLKILNLVDGFSSSHDIFRLGPDFSVKHITIISDRFKNIYEKNLLTGIRFIET